VPLDERTAVGVLGAGAMGSGIAQVAAAAGHRVVVVDAREAAVTAGRDGLDRALARDVAKGRRTAADADALRAGVTWHAPSGTTPDVSAFAPCGLVVEAIVEDLAVKRAAFQAIEQAVAPECVLATNTSSLAVTAIAAACARAERVIGVHFFNPAPLMPLVEIVPALQT
jgi:3-hydroxybutyryl-CoA dehydrogenase